MSRFFNVLVLYILSVGLFFYLALNWFIAFEYLQDVLSFIVMSSFYVVFIHFLLKVFPENKKIIKLLKITITNSLLFWSLIKSTAIIDLLTRGGVDKLVHHIYRDWMLWEIVHLVLICVVMSYLLSEKKTPRNGMTKFLMIRRS